MKTLAQTLKDAGLRGGVEFMADTMGVSRGTIANHFKTDGPIFYAYLDYTLRRQREDVAAAMAVSASKLVHDHMTVSACVRDHDVELTFRSDEHQVVTATRIPADLPVWGTHVLSAVAAAKWAL